MSVDSIPALTIDSVRDGLRSRSFSAEELAREALRFAQRKTRRQMHS